MEDDGDKPAGEEPRRDDADVALFRDRMLGRAQTLAELQRLSDFLWRDAQDQRDFEDRVLSEPPEMSGIIAPRELISVLSDIRKLLRDKSVLAPEEHEAYNVARERLAISFCAIDSAPRENRLSAGFRKLVLERTDADDVTRPTSVRWSARLTYALVTEFDRDRRPGNEGLIAMGRDAHALAVHASETSREELKYLHGYCELTLRELQGALASAADAAARDPLWSEAIRSIPQAMFLAPPKSESVADRLGAELKQVIWVTLTSRSDEPAEQASRSVGLFLGPRGEQLRFVGLLEQALATVLMIVQARDDLGIPVQHHGARTMSILKKATVEHRVYQHEVGKLSIEEMALRIKAQIPLPAKPELDEKAVADYVDRLAAKRRKRQGIALSGGGFRATCFHLGVLACLAERDELRDIDTISCVSGGSIVGAAYAVRLKALLSQKTDVDVTREDYIAVVQDLIDTVGEVCSGNLRMRALANPLAILKMWLSPAYTFTDRIAELLDRLLFLPLLQRHADFDEPLRAGLRGRPLPHRMTKPGIFALAIEVPPLGWPLGPWDLDAPPLGDGPRNAPRVARLAKATEVTFNTTSVNSGAGFAFSQRAHGERPDLVTVELSDRPRLAWLRYDDITTGAGFDPKAMKLSRIVAASASVPGIIPPVLLERVGQSGLIAVADGGLFDNQGTDQLLEARCENIIVSDACGQLRFDAYPDVGALPVMLRSTDILMERVRELGHRRVLDAVAQARVASVAHLHLTKGLREPPPASPFRPDDAMANTFVNARRSTPTAYGVISDIQAQLARLRTDLDCFCELEVFSLMLDGYLQASKTLPEPPGAQQTPAHSWSFDAVRPAMTVAGQGVRLGIVLRAGTRRFFRLPALLWGLFQTAAPGLVRIASWVAALCAAGLLILAGRFGSTYLMGTALSRPTPWIALLALVGVWLLILRIPPSGSKRWVAKLASGPLLMVAMLVAWAVLLVGDPLYRRLGRLEPRHGDPAADRPAGAART